MKIIFARIEDIPKHILTYPHRQVFDEHYKNQQKQGGANYLKYLMISCLMSSANAIEARVRQSAGFWKWSTWVS